MHLNLPRLSDYHVHMRQWPNVGQFAEQSARYCGRLLAMPNTNPPIDTAERATAYHKSISTYTGSHVDVLTTLKLVPATTAQTVRECDGVPCIAGFKLYPAGVTTHSADGISADVINYPDRHTAFGDVLDAMQTAKLVLCLHGEHPEEDDPFEREPKFHRFVHWVLSNFPKLRVVMEHITTAASVDFVLGHGRPDRLAATITAHHLMVHYGHMCGSAASPGEKRFGCGDGRLHPHLFCWPVAKKPSDREALVRAATSGDPCFFLGSDSAPHPTAAKESACGCAGVYSAPVLPEAIVQVFYDRDRVDSLPAFVAESGDRFYHRRPVEAPPLRAVRAAWTVPATVGDVVPFLAGCQLDWRVESR